jgi:hypothetical protein
MLRDGPVRSLLLLLGASAVGCAAPTLPGSAGPVQPSIPGAEPGAWAEVRGDAVTVLPFEAGAFRVPISTIDYYSQRSPRSALRTWIRAWDAKRFDVLLRLIPEADQKGLTPEALRERLAGQAAERLAVLLDVLRLEVENGLIQSLGDRATMSYGSGRAVHLHLEGALWKIEDF